MKRREIETAAQEWWQKFWMQSSISTPTLPALEYTWYGSLYITAGFASMDPSVPPSSLYGPWVSSDNPGWNGIAPALGCVGFDKLEKL